MVHTFIRYIIVIFLSLLSLSLTYSQNFNFSHYSIEEGLSQSVVNCIFQDSEGYLWFGTQDGLNRFDGYNFKKYIQNPLDSNSISSNWIYSISEDLSGNMLIGTRSGLNILNKKHNKVRRIIHSPDEETSDYKDAVYSVKYDKRGFIITNTPPYLNFIDPETGEHEHFKNSIGLNSAIEDESLPSLIDRDNLIWVGTKQGLACFDFLTKKFKNYIHNHDANSISDNRVTSIFQDKNGHVWIGTRNGLNKLDRNNNKIFRYYHDIQNNNSIGSDIIYAIIQDYSGAYWIGTDGRGLDRMQLTKDNKINCMHFRSKESRSPEFLSHDIVLSLLLDKSQNLWIGTLNGIDKTDLKRKKFNLYQKSAKLQSVNLLDNVVASVYKDSLNRLWVGNWGKGLNIIDRKTNEIIYYTSTSPGKFRISNDYVHVIFEDPKGNVWLGTRNGIDMYNKKNQRFLPIREFFKSDKIYDFHDNRVYCILEDHLKNIWVGTRDGLYYMNMKDFSSKRYFAGKIKQESTSDNLIYCIVQDKEKNLWIGTTNGLDKFDYKTGQFTHFMHDPANRNTICDNFIASLCIDYQDNIWIGTKSGANKYNKKYNIFTYYSEIDGIPGNTIYEIIEDKQQNIWLATGKGLCVLKKNTEVFRAYDMNDGLQSLEFNLKASYKSKDGEIFFGGMNGVNSFYIDSLRDNAFIPPVYITNFSKTNGTSKQSLPLGDEIISLTHNDQEFTIEFAALEYSDPQKNRYAYKMEGINKEWIEIGNRHFVPFSNLPAGKYTFKVKGTNSDGVWNEEGTSITIDILPPWWWSTKSIIIYILLSLGISLSIIKMREKNLHYQKEVLESKVKERTNEVEKQKSVIIDQNNELFFQNERISRQRDELKVLNATKDRLFSIIGHDLKNPFTAIISMVDLLKKNFDHLSAEDIKQTIDHLYHSSKNGVDLLDNLLQWARLQRKQLEAQHEIINLNLAIEENINFFRNSAQSKNINLKSDISRKLNALADKNMVNTIMRNLISNSIKFTSQNGIIEIKATPYENDDKFLQISISDNGLGIKESDLDKLFKSEEYFTTKGTNQEKGTGLGLLLCKELVEKNGGQISCTSEYGKGSTFSFTLFKYNNNQKT